MLRQVKTENGWVRGIEAADPRITAFKGVPFAAPPTGRSDCDRPGRLAAADARRGRSGRAAVPDGQCYRYVYRAKIRRSVPCTRADDAGAACCRYNDLAYAA